MHEPTASRVVVEALALIAGIAGILSLLWVQL